MIQSSFPSGDWKKPLCPGPNAFADSDEASTGDRVFFHDFGFNRSADAGAVSIPSEYPSVQHPPAEYTRKILSPCRRNSGPSSTSTRVLLDFSVLSHDRSGDDNRTRLPLIVHGSDISAM